LFAIDFYIFSNLSCFQVGLPYTKCKLQSLAVTLNAKVDFCPKMNNKHALLRSIAKQKLHNFCKSLIFVISRILLRITIKE